MSEPEIEPGLLPLFRLFVALQLGLAAMMVFASHAHWNVHTPVMLCGPPGILAITAVYLFWPGLPKRMGRWYLPIGLFGSIILPLGSFTALAMASGDLEGTVREDSTWKLLFLLFPLLLASWQYRFRWVVAASLGVSLGDIFLMATGFSHDELVAANYGRDVFVRLMIFLIVGYIVTRLMEAQRRQRLALVEANARLALYAATQEQLAVSQERNRLARELHDILAHTLSGIAVQLEAARALRDTDMEGSHKLVDQSLVATRAGLGETRRALHALRAAPLQDLGLRQALKALGESAAERAGFRLALSLPENLDDLPPAAEQALYRAAQEALENIVRHAGARNVQVGVERHPKMAALTVIDDGGGFDPQAQVNCNHGDHPNGVAESQREGHYGLCGLRERAEALGGSLSIESHPGAGTTLRFEAPV